jgi:hypothetical protein
VRDELEAWLQQNIKAEAMPSGIRPEHIARRVERLVSQRQDIPLSALAELKLYHARELLDLKGLLDACQKLTDEPTGLTLVAGDSAARLQLLQRWLPIDPEPEEIIQVVRERDDD